MLSSRTRVRFQATASRWGEMRVLRLRCTLKKSGWSNSFRCPTRQRAPPSTETSKVSATDIPIFFLLFKISMISFSTTNSCIASCSLATATTFSSCSVCVRIPLLQLLYTRSAFDNTDMSNSEHSSSLLYNEHAIYHLSRADHHNPFYRPHRV